MDRLQRSRILASNYGVCVGCIKGRRQAGCGGTVTVGTDSLRQSILRQVTAKDVELEPRAEMGNSA